MMKNPCIRPIVLALLLALPAAPLLAKPAQETPSPPTALTTTRFEIRFLDLHTAEQIAWDQCPEKERCQISASAFVNDSSVKWVGDKSLKGFLEVRSDSATHERIVRALAKADAAPLTQSFQLLLLAASTHKAAGDPDVPAGAQKALADLRGFLPYKDYKLLDSTWLRATQDRPTEGRVVGRGDQGYSVKLQFRTTGNDQMFLDRFQLNEELMSQRPASEAKKGEPGIAPRAPRDLISTSFSLKKGETIVVGTSKLDGSDEALVVLLTAVPQG
ncbi:MAG TPA: hypothetical protein VGQ28_10055 [Thermoanaerobaculia bacterium]|nr:hypothetical protein [Thermoanaerobaculia bacterium]